MNNILIVHFSSINTTATLSFTIPTHSTYYLLETFIFSWLYFGLLEQDLYTFLPLLGNTSLFGDASLNCVLTDLRRCISENVLICDVLLFFQEKLLQITLTDWDLIMKPRTRAFDVRGLDFRISIPGLGGELSPSLLMGNIDFLEKSVTRIHILGTQIPCSRRQGENSYCICWCPCTCRQTLSRRVL